MNRIDLSQEYQPSMRRRIADAWLACKDRIIEVGIVLCIVVCGLYMLDLLISIIRFLLF